MRGRTHHPLRVACTRRFGCRLRSIEIEGACSDVEKCETGRPKVLPCRGFAANVENALAVPKLTDKPLHSAIAEAGSEDPINLSRESHDR